MKGICDIKDCTGCGLCASVCTQKCIKMTVRDKLGHLYPCIDSSLCTDCGKCRRLCPVLNKVPLVPASAAYAAWARDDNEYRSSSSGGAAAVMSRHIIHRGGVVYGCAMLPGVRVKHIRVDAEENLPLLKGSKYVQSDIADALESIKEDVALGRPVLFVGTPCQVAAVAKLFSVRPDNLYLIDLVCHGVPSVKMLKRHVDKIIPGRDCHSVVFRNGNDFGLKILADDGERVSASYESYLNTSRYKDFYINSFMDGYTYRDSCYRCTYACGERVGDITIGDFWGLGKYLPSDEIPPHESGCSLIMPVTAKGSGLVEEIKPLMNIYQRTVCEAVEGNDQLRSAMRKGPRKVLYRALARRFEGEWPYYLVVADLRVRRKLKMFFGKRRNCK